MFGIAIKGSDVVAVTVLLVVLRGGGGGGGGDDEEEHVCLGRSGGIWGIFI